MTSALIHTDRVVWNFLPGELPDDGLTVLVAIEDNDCGPWPAYIEEGIWHDASSATRLNGEVYAWTSLDAPSRQEGLR